MKYTPIISIDVKEQMKVATTSATCNYAGCGLINDGWPWSPVAY